MQFWEEIINTALLGTDKRAVAVGQLPTELAAVAERIAGGDKEEQFLQLAAVAFNFRQSGVIPLQREGVDVPQALPEEMPYCSPAAALALKDVLEEENNVLLGYWLQLCARSRWIVVPDVLPVLLNKAVNQVWMQPLIAAAGGKRGEWIRAFNPAWQFGGDVLSEDETWQTGTMAQRVACLRRWRLQEPDKARTMLMATWAQENANGKAELLRQLDGTVVEEDREWLEGLLGEKSQKVKEEVLGLLLQLPGSSVVERNWETVRAGVGLKKERALLGMVNKVVFTVDLADPQLLDTIPPAYLEGHLGIEPAAIIEYFRKDHAKLLIHLAAAIWRFRDVRWAEALARVDDGYYPAVVPLLSRAHQEGYLLRGLGDQATVSAILMRLSEWEGEWSLELARAVLGHTARSPYQYTASFYAAQVVRLPVSIVAELDKFAPPEPHLRVMWDKLNGQIKALLALKERIAKAFN